MFRWEDGDADDVEVTDYHQEAPRCAARGAAPPDASPANPPGRDAPGEVSEALGITQSAFARQLGVSFPRLNEVIHGKRSVTSDTELRLARVTGMSADFWLGLQQDWDLWNALRTEKAKEIEHLTPLAVAGLSGDPDG